MHHPKAQRGCSKQPRLQRGAARTLGSLTVRLNQIRSTARRARSASMELGIPRYPIVGHDQPTAGAGLSPVDRATHNALFKLRLKPLQESVNQIRGEVVSMSYPGPHEVDSVPIAELRGNGWTGTPPVCEVPRQQDSIDLSVGQEVDSIA